MSSFVRGFYSDGLESLSGLSSMSTSAKNRDLGNVYTGRGRVGVMFTVESERDRGEAKKLRDEDLFTSS